MAFKCLVLLGLLLGLCLTSLGLAQSFVPSNPLGPLALLKNGVETRRASSCAPDWRNGNGDARYIAPHETLVIADLKGPGRIVHIWFTIAHQAKYYSRLMSIRMYWDGEKNPSVECPLGDFFVIGHGVDKSFSSLPVRVSSSGRARNCYWPMPFKKSAKITITNDSDLPCLAFYYYVDWQKLDKLPPNAGYFHAHYRQEFPARMGRNFLVADIRGHGHYVGTVESVYHTSPGWFGEGDDFFFIDGAKEPQLRGTGTEDYFCNAWGFSEFDGPFYGVPLWEGFNTSDRGTAYRWHLCDPIYFKKSLRVELEHKGSQVFPDGAASGFIERDDLISTVAFWYQKEPHKPWAPLPPGSARLPFHEKVLLEGESALKTCKASQPDQVYSQGLPGASGGQQLFYTAFGADQRLEVAFKSPTLQSALLVLSMFTAPDYGKWQVLIDGKPYQVLDLYAPLVRQKDFLLRNVDLAAGDHTLTFVCKGHNPESKGDFLGFDALAERQPVYFRPPSEDLRKLQVPQPK